MRRELCRLSYQCSFQSLVEKASSLRDSRLQGILLTGIQPHSRRATCLVPNKFNQTCIGNDSFKMISRYSLVSEVWQPPRSNSSPRQPTPTLTCMACNHYMDNFGDHASCCPRSSLRTKRHNNARDISGKHATAAGASVVREVKGLVANPLGRPADNKLSDIQGILPDKSLWVDYAIPSPFAGHCLDDTCRTYAFATSNCKCENDKLLQLPKSLAFLKRYSSPSSWQPLVVSLTRRSSSLTS